MAAILDFFEVAPMPKLKIRFRGIITPKMALLSTRQQFHLATYNLFKIPGSHLENGGHIGFFQVVPRLKLKVRFQGIIMPKMAPLSTMVTIVTLSHQTHTT